MHPDRARTPYPGVLAVKHLSHSHVFTANMADTEGSKSACQHSPLAKRSQWPKGHPEGLPGARRGLQWPSGHPRDGDASFTAGNYSENRSMPDGDESHGTP